jgi:pilus assembly protein Flp/PilA
MFLITFFILLSLPHTYLKGFYLTNDAGVTSIEYALVGALIAVVIVTAVTSIGNSLTPIFTTIASKL